MDRNELLYIIGDYCSHYEIEITDEEMEQAADTLAERVAEEEEYNTRCGVHSVNIDLILDGYFDDFEFWG